MPKSLERCVAKVRKQKGIRESYAVCTAARNRKRGRR